VAQAGEGSDVLIWLPFAARHSKAGIIVVKNGLDPEASPRSAPNRPQLRAVAPRDRLGRRCRRAQVDLRQPVVNPPRSETTVETVAETKEFVVRGQARSEHDIGRVCRIAEKRART
jgi:hypothetical protein